MPFEEDAPPRLRGPLRQAASWVATSLWIAPTAAAVVALLLATWLLEADPSVAWLPMDLDDAAAAQAGLTSIVTATVTAVSLVATGTIVALQLAAGQYSPRLLREVLDDPRVRGALAGLVGVVVYALVVVVQTTEDDPAPAAVALGVALGIVAIGLLVLFVHRITGRIRLETILEEVTDTALQAIAATYPRDGVSSDVEVPDHARPLHARRSGYVQTVSLDALADVAASHGVHLRLRLPVGEYLVRGTTAAWAWAGEGADGDADGTAEALEEAVDHALALGVDRTMEGDPAYGLRHLVDIALRAISPAVNDPTTAVQCVHNGTRILVELAERPLVDGRAERDGCTASLPRPDLADHLALAQAQVLQYGGGDARVVEALAQQLRDLAEATDADRDVLRACLDELQVDTGQRDLRPRDRALVDDALRRVEDALSGVVDDDEDVSAG